MTWEFIGRKDAFDYITVNNRSAVELDQFLSRKITIPTSLFSAKKINISRQALLMLASLNEYDQKQVVKEMYFVSANPSAKSVVRHKRNPLIRIFRSTYPFKNYHYLITCILKDGMVVIHDIAFDEKLHGRRISTNSYQRTQMYHVKREQGKDGEYDGSQGNTAATALLSEWRHNRAKQTHKVNTIHASVNGMLNGYQKAVTLMGLHTQVAYNEDQPREYTLFHNPSDGWHFDIIECGFDKFKLTSHNAQHLATVMKQCAEQRKKVKWTVHSQGAIIFNTALIWVKRRYPTLKLTNQEVAVHAGGVSTEKIEMNANRIGMKFNSNKTRTNPFDLVPNIAARQTPLSPSSLVRCCKFIGLVINGDVTESPHTLPYFGLVSYRQQLIMSGSKRALKRVRDVDSLLLKNKE
ncbi:hypothetical protein WMQ67_08680 [Vibrio harveyi]|uniref:hypothetical protein n=2 Tax=Vibrio harveyi TaxID=669 RepID=UPI00211A8D1D|nr:hypothetical protein [Vibrio harveyi]EKO3861529.1 hypothetical protein [Vibrio harveyi]MCQ9081642.1 hypothetical protein [Vibrio harveyi]